MEQEHKIPIFEETIKKVAELTNSGVDYIRESYPNLLSYVFNLETELKISKDKVERILEKNIRLENLHKVKETEYIVLHKIVHQDNKDDVDIDNVQFIARKVNAYNLSEAERMVKESYSHLNIECTIYQITIAN